MRDSGNSQLDDDSKPAAVSFLIRKLPDSIAEVRPSGRVLIRLEELRIIAERSARGGA